jgi:ATP-dependent Clp protease, proteolytic subunit ClpP
MIHQPLISGGLKGQATDISIHANELLKIKDRLAELLARNTGKTKEQILNDTERDNYLSSEEAVRYGLIDSVFKR